MPKNNNPFVTVRKDNIVLIYKPTCRCIPLEERGNVGVRPDMLYDGPPCCEECGTDYDFKVVQVRKARKKR